MRKRPALSGLLLSLCTLSTTPLSAQERGDDLFAQIDAVFAEWDTTASPGCAVGVYRDGRIEYARGYGMADLERSVTNGPHSVFDIASTSKQFVAMCILLLEEQGRLRLDDDLRRHVPEMPDYGDVITIRHLLHHTSGIRDYLVLMSLAGMPFAHDYPEAQIVDLLARQEALNFRPGDDHLYSNSGYFLLGEIIRRAAGRTPGAFAAEMIFEPLGMRSTELYDDYRRVVKNRAIGYAPAAGGGFATEVYLFDLVGDGGVLTSVEDLARWDANFYDNRLGAGSPTLIERMLVRGRLNSGETLGYACGLGVGHYRGLPTVSHGGAWAGYRAELLRFPEQRVSVAVLANLGTISPTALARRVADIVLADQLAAPPAAAARVPAEPSAAPPAAETSGHDVAARAGAYRNPATGRIWRLVLESDGLHLVPAADQDFRLVARDATRLDAVNAPVPIRLEFEGDGAATRMRVTINDADTHEFERLDLSAPDPAALASLAGRYRSDELDVTYEIRADAGGLTVTIGYRPPVTLEATLEDEFEYGGATIRFERDDRGAPTGFTVSAGRVRNIAFRRISSSPG